MIVAVVDRYDGDVLAGFSMRSQPTVLRVVPIDIGFVLEEPGSGFVGAVIRVFSGLIELEDRRGAVRSFPLTSRFLIDGEPVRVQVAPKAATAPARTASGSLAPVSARARVAQPSRIFVEGRHDAELIERFWGEDLRVGGGVVE